MSYQDETKYSPETDEQDKYTSPRQERRERRAERRAGRETGGSGWLIGLVLIIIGGIYLLNNMGLLPDFNLNNWWALFILLPAAGSLSAGIGAYRNSGGHWTMQAIFPLIAGLLFLLLTVVFLFDLNYGWLWPLFLIAGGLMLLTIPLTNRDHKTDVPK